LATRAVADRDNLGSGPADEGLHIGVPAWVVFTADGGQVDGQHGEPHAGLQHPGEGFEEGAVGTAGAGAVVAPLQRFMWFPSRETHQVSWLNQIWVESIPALGAPGFIVHVLDLAQPVVANLQPRAQDPKAVAPSDGDQHKLKAWAVSAQFRTEFGLRWGLDLLGTWRRAHGRIVCV